MCYHSLTEHRCAYIATPAHGTKNTSDVHVGAVVQLRCDDGYTFTAGVRSVELTCDESELWDDVIPDCQRESNVIHCARVFCIHVGLQLLYCTFVYF